MNKVYSHQNGNILEKTSYDRSYFEAYNLKGQEIGYFPSIEEARNCLDQDELMHEQQDRDAEYAERYAECVGF